MYDLSKGALFVLKAKGEQVEVRQLSRDLSAIPFDAKCRDVIENDAEILKVVRPTDLPK